MKLVTCTGYFSTGSSAVADLLDEYNDCSSPVSDYEIRFIYDPDGVADLEYHLVENHNRHNSGHALKRYKRLVDFYCGSKLAPKNEAYFHGKWKEYSYQYINELTEFSYNGSWLYDYLDRGIGFHYFNSILRKVFKTDMLKNSITYCSYPTKEVFTKLTKDYIDKLMCVANEKGTGTFVVDQLLPPSDIKRYVPYFDSIKVIVVDRDPRDIFFLEKYIRKEQVLPTDVKDFCKWFEYTRRHRSIENVNTDYSILIQFEDLIYQYEATVRYIENFVGLNTSDHTLCKTRFVPEKSINNTQIWRRMDLTEQQGLEVRILSEELSDYLYPFPEMDIKKGKQRIE